MDLRVRTEQIKEKGLDLEREFSTPEVEKLLQADPPISYRVKENAPFEARLERVKERDILFRGKVGLSVEADCKRCLTKVPVSIPVEFSLDLVDRDRYEMHPSSSQMEDDGSGEIAGTFSPDEANQVFFSGREIDLAPIVREQLLLALPPMGVLCERECKGLCQVCGHDLNRGDCGCDRHVVDPRWAGLKDIKL